MTRILVLSNMYPPHHYGGYEQSCKDVMDRFRRRGHDVTVLTTTMRVRGVADPPGERAEEIRRDLSWYWDDHVILNPPIWTRLAMERRNQDALRRAIVETRPDVVSAWNMGAMSLGLLTTVIEARIPLVLSVCDEWPIYGPKLDAWARLFVGRPRLGSTVRRLTGVPTTIGDLETKAAFLFVSGMIRRKIEKLLGWRPPVAGIVYSGIDAGDFPLTESAPEQPWRWRLLYTGRIDERKGIHVALEALTLLPAEATLDIYGRGDEEYLARLRDLIGRLGLSERVRFDVSPRETLHLRYREADALVFPTLWEEPFGLVPVEAMACGTPVVATGTGGSGEFLLDGVNCLRVSRGDPAALAAGLRRLAADDDLRERLVAAGRRTAAELTVDRLAEVMEEWHVSAVGGFGSELPRQRRLAIT